MADENQMTVEDAFQKAVEAGGKDDAETFGWYLGMSAMGHGVCWEDDNPDIGLQYPYVEYILSADAVNLILNND